MSGHSKWHNIRLRKGKQDAQKGKIFTRLGREIIMAAKQGGGNPDSNARLRLAMQRAREAGMPQDNVKRAIQKGTGELEGINYEDAVYEGYGPAGVAVMVETLTDNRKRTVSELRYIFSRQGGSLGETGCVAWMFDQKGVIAVPRSQTEEDTLLELALEAGAEDVRSDDDSFEVTTVPADLEKVRDALVKAGIQPENAEVTMLPRTTVRLDEKDAHQMLRLMDALEEQEDVQQIYANFDIPESVLAQAA